MPLISMRQLLDHAAENNYGVPAFDPRAYLKETITAMKDIAVARYEAFGTAGNAAKIVPLGLSVMSNKYSEAKLGLQINGC